MWFLNNRRKMNELFHRKLRIITLNRNPHNSGRRFYSACPTLCYIRQEQFLTWRHLQHRVLIWFPPWATILDHHLLVSTLFITSSSCFIMLSCKSACHTLFIAKNGQDNSERTISGVVSAWWICHIFTDQDILCCAMWNNPGSQRLAVIPREMLKILSQDPLLQYLFYRQKPRKITFSFSMPFENGQKQ